jgi:hypothetical protein
VGAQARDSAKHLSETASLGGWPFVLDQPAALQGRQPTRSKMQYLVPADPASPPPSLKQLRGRARAKLVADIAAGRVVINVAQLIEQSIAKAEEIVNRATDQAKKETDHE